MQLTHEQIKAEIASGDITAISLDTSIFENSHNRFEHAPLSQLKQFRGSSVRLLLSDVVEGEVKSHVIRDAKTAQTAVRAAVREIGQKWQTSNAARDKAMETLFNEESPEAMCERRFAAFAEMTGLTVIQSEPLVSVSRILDDYFSARAPFGTKAVKKSEFPDAIALHALENWAKGSGTKVLVVTKDGDWKSFCEPSPNLVVVDELSDALSMFHRDATVVCSLISGLINSEQLLLQDNIQSALQNDAEYLNFVPDANAAYYYEPEVEMVEVESYELLPIQQHGDVLLKPVDHSEDYLVAEALARVTLAVTTSFSFSVTDSIDRDEVPMGSASVTESIELIGKVFLTFEGNLSTSPQVTHVEAEFERRTYDIDYGEVGPDWQDYEE
jgi:hypothetical protein